VVSIGIAFRCRRDAATAGTVVLAAGVSAWTLVASVVLPLLTVETLGFAGSLAIGSLSLVGLTAQELSVEASCT
jgi:hypothetical protein